MKNWIKKNKELIVVIVYLIVTFALLFFHKNWRDEAQTWLIARDCSLLELINIMKYEGHFLLWYLILMPFAKLGFPYFTCNIISWIITSISVWLILVKSPFKFYKKVLFVFSFPFLYLFPIVSRCYCLIPLAIVLMSMFYKDRKEKPLKYLLSIVLLVNTHVIMLGMASIVLLEYIVEVLNENDKNQNKKIIKNLIFSIVLIIFSVLPLIGCLSTNKDLGVNESIIKKLMYTFLYCPIMIVFELYSFFRQDRLISMIIMFFVVMIFVYEVIKNPKQILKIYLCVLWQCFIYAFIYIYSEQRAATVLLIIMYYKWINSNQNDQKEIKTILNEKIVNIIFVILLVFNIIHGILYIGLFEIYYNSSNAFEMAEYINNNLEDGSIVLSGPRAEFITSIIPYVNKNIDYYQIKGNRFFTYVLIDDINREKIEIEDINSLNNKFKDNQKLYYIYSKDKVNVSKSFYIIDEKDLIDDCIENNIFKKIYETDDISVNNENYVLYEVKLKN